MCQMPNIWHICHTKHKNEASSNVSNSKNYTTPLQYRLKYEIVRTNVVKNYIVLYSLFSLLSLHFFFSLLSLTSSLSLLPVPVPSLFDQSGMFTGSDDGIASTTTVRYATLDQPHQISPTLSHARSRRSHPEATVDLTLFPLLSVHLSLCLSLVVGFFFFFAAIWVVGCGGRRWFS